MTPTELDLIPLRELTDAILRRADHGIVVLLKVDGAGPGWNEYIRRWRGNSHTVAGLAMDGAHSAIKDFKSGCIDAEDGPAPDVPFEEGA